MQNRMQKSMKKPKKWPKICLYMALGLIVVAFGIYFYLCYDIYDEFGATKEFYGEKFDELYSLDSLSSEITDAVMDDVKEAFSYMGTETEQFGPLSRYCISTEYFPDAVKHEFTVDLVASGTSDSEKYMWIAYARTAYDADGNIETLSGTKDERCLARLTIENIDGVYTVTEILEHP